MVVEWLTCPWDRGGARHLKWTRWPQFKPWTRLSAFPIALERYASYNFPSIYGQIVLYCQWRDIALGYKNTSLFFITTKGSKWLCEWVSQRERETKDPDRGSLSLTSHWRQAFRDLLLLPFSLGPLSPPQLVSTRWLFSESDQISMSTANL